MKQHIKTIPCQNHFENTSRTSPFLVVKYTLDYNSDIDDRELIDCLIEEAEAQARRVNPHAANSTSNQRSDDTLIANNLAGVLSEYFWKVFLNRNSVIVCSTSFEDAANQIDLKIIGSDKKIEVRSSFPRNGLHFAICHPDYEFDILGPYHNQSYKPGEIKKHFYVRTLFCFSSVVDIIEKIKQDGFELYLTGGATWSMMNNRHYFIIKDLIPDDVYGQTQKTNYRVVPFSRALDTFQIDALITASAISSKESESR